MSLLGSVTTLARSPVYVWQEAHTSAPQAIAIAVHGLNLKPEKMDPIGEHLRTQGASVLRVSLAGHRGDVGAPVSRARWFEEMRLAMHTASERAHNLGLPLYYVGFSLGAVLGEDFLNSPDGAAFAPQKRVFFSPAFKVRSRAKLIKLLFGWGNAISTPSLTPRAYRANNWTPVSAFQALFDCIEHLAATPMVRSRLPTLVFLEPKDELVDPSAVRAMIDKKKLDHQWKIVEVTTDGTTLAHTYHHLITDKEAVGPTQWRRMTDAMDAFLFQ